MIVNQPYIIITGPTGQDLRVEDVDGITVDAFSIGQTAHVWDEQARTWRSDTTTWFTAHHPSRLSDRFAELIEQGAELSVSGDLRCEAWIDQDGVARCRMIVRAWDVMTAERAHAMQESRRKPH